MTSQLVIWHRVYAILVKYLCINQWGIAVLCMYFWHDAAMPLNKTHLCKKGVVLHHHGLRCFDIGNFQQQHRLICLAKPVLETICLKCTVKGLYFLPQKTIWLYYRLPSGFYSIGHVTLWCGWSVAQSEDTLSKQSLKKYSHVYAGIGGSG